MDAQLQTESLLDSIYVNHHSSISSTHVKGHQDKVVGPLTWEEHLNVLADSLAEQSSMSPCPLDLPLPASQISLWHKGHQVTRSLKSFIQREWQWQQYSEYAKTKFQWSELIMADINWSLSQTRKIPAAKRVFLASLAHDWLPLNKPLHARGACNSSLCLVCAREDETALHFLICDSYSKSSVSSLVARISKLSSTLSIDPELSTIMWKGMLNQVEDVRLNPLSFPPLYRPLIVQQNWIGWRQMWFGRWGNRWTTTLSSLGHTKEQEYQIT